MHNTNFMSLSLHLDLVYFVEHNVQFNLYICKIYLKLKLKFNQQSDLSMSFHTQYHDR
jgi:hypothetical protein